MQMGIIKIEVKIQTSLNWLRIGSNGWLLWTWYL